MALFDGKYQNQGYIADVPKMQAYTYKQMQS